MNHKNVKNNNDIYLLTYYLPNILIPFCIFLLSLFLALYQLLLRIFMLGWFIYSNPSYLPLFLWSPNDTIGNNKRQKKTHHTLHHWREDWRRTLQFSASLSPFYHERKNFDSPSPCKCWHILVVFFAPFKNWNGLTFECYKSAVEGV